MELLRTAAYEATALKACHGYQLFPGGHVIAIVSIVKTIWQFALGFLAGFTFKAVLVWRSNRRTVRQSGNIVGGNLAGGDVNIREDRQK